MVHYYADIDAQKLYDTIRNHAKDIEAFLAAVKAFLKNPEKFSLTVR